MNVKVDGKVTITYNLSLYASLLGSPGNVWISCASHYLHGISFSSPVRPCSQFSAFMKQRTVRVVEMVQSQRDAEELRRRVLAQQTALNANASCPLADRTNSQRRIP